MPWNTPTLREVRQTNRDYIVGKLGVPLIPNDYPRVLADANAGNAHLNLQYLDWLSEQLLPDTAEQLFLDKWANIFLINADGSRGRKAASFATGTATIVATLAGTVLPAGTIFAATSANGTVNVQSTAQIVAELTATPFPIRSLEAGAVGNLAAGTALAIASSIPGLDSSSTQVVGLSGGTEVESDDELRVRVLARIRQPPMGGDADDYVAWALRVAGVTRAWCAPNEMGPGSVTLRFMCDDLRATSDPLTNGYPLPQDVAAVRAYVNTVRPVTVRDLFVCAPTPQPLAFTISGLVPNSTATRAAIAANVAAMLRIKARPSAAVNGSLVPAQTIPAAWVSAAILAAAGVTTFDLSMVDAVMPSAGAMAVLTSNSITYV